MPTRRQFLTTAALLTTPALLHAAPKDPLPIDPATGDDLQAQLNRHDGTGQTLRINSPRTLTCFVHEQLLPTPYGTPEKSIQPLLIPAGVHLDLNGSTLLLDCRSNSYGIRLSDNSSIRNGTVKLIRSEGKGSQSCWHSCLSIGAAYGDGGTPERPGLFSKVEHWAAENLTLDQPFEASAIQLMSEACHGILRNITILDSDKALLGIGMDWGSVGPITTEDKEVPRMRQLWDAGQIYSTHPHDILIENLKVGRFTRNVDGNDAAVRCSACHNITIRNVQVAEAAVGVALFGGDFGYEFARNDLRHFQHQGYLIENLRIDKARIFGLVLNGSADNIYRASLNHGYAPLRDPNHPGLDRPQLKNLSLTGDRSPKPQGIYTVAVTDARFEDTSLAHFAIGLHAEDFTTGLHFHHTTFRSNTKDTQLEGTRSPATSITFQ